MLLGRESIARLEQAHVAVFGIGGVGGYVVEALARSGIGELTLIDSDVVAESNLNRQIIATYDTVGQYKVDAAKERVLSVNPECVVHVRREFYLPETSGTFDFAEYSYVADAIDTVSGKIALIVQAKEAGVPVISAMGAGNKLNPAAFEVADIAKTSVCPLAAVMRRELKRRGISGVKCVYSKEEVRKPNLTNETGESTETAHKRVTPGSVAFVPGAMGLIMAGEIIKDLCGKQGE